jgi:hypothetical protein
MLLRGKGTHVAEWIGWRGVCTCECTVESPIENAFARAGVNAVVYAGAGRICARLVSPLTVTR